VAQALTNACAVNAALFAKQFVFFGIDENDNALDPSVSRDPYFYKCVYKITARQLIELGFLTPLVAGEINAQSYDTSGLKIQANGQFSNASVKAAFEGWGRKTAGIVADIVALNAIT